MMYVLVFLADRAPKERLTMTVNQVLHVCRKDFLRLYNFPHTVYKSVLVSSIRGVTTS